MGWTVQGSNPRKGKRFFSLKCPDLLQGLHSLLFSGHLGSFPWVKWPGHDVDSLPSSSAKIKNG